MIEPSNTTALTTAVTAAWLTALLPGVDANAAVGAFCGATLFVISAEELGIGTRAVYLIISFLIGYLGGPTTLSPWIEHSAVSAFIGAAVAVTAALRAIEGVKRVDLGRWLGGGRQ